MGRVSVRTASRIPLADRRSVAPAITPDAPAVCRSRVAVAMVIPGVDHVVDDDDAHAAVHVADHPAPGTLAAG
jgi:hypothetical protein